MKFRFAWLLDLLSIAAVAALGKGCGSCPGAARTVDVVVLDAVTLDPVCAVITPPGFSACPATSVNSGPEGETVEISAPGYKPLSYKVMPKFREECTPGGGCNVVLLERQ